MYLSIPLIIIEGIIFLFVLGFLNKILFKPILKILHEREEKTEGFLRDADEKKKTAQSSLEQYELGLRKARKEALGLKKQHVAEGASERTAVLEKARQEAGASLEEIKAKISQASEAARKTLHQQAQTMAREIAEKVLGRGV